MFGINMFREILFFESVLIFECSVFAIEICRHFDPFVSIQKLAALYFEVCFKSIIYASCCSNALAENISLTLMSVLERFSVPR